MPEEPRDEKPPEPAPATTPPPAPAPAGGPVVRPVAPPPPADHPHDQHAPPERLILPRQRATPLAILFLLAIVGTFAWATRRSYEVYTNAAATDARQRGETLAPGLDKDRLLLALQNAGGMNGKYLLEVGHLDWSKYDGRPWRVVTTLFVETSWIMVLLLVLMGWGPMREMERLYGSFRFALLYLFGGMSCLLFCDLIQTIFPSASGLTIGRSGAAHAIFVIWGALPGYVLGTQGFRAMITSKLIWGRFIWIGVIIVLSFLLRQTSSPVGLVVGRWLIDLVGGLFFGATLALTLDHGGRQAVGIVLTGLLLCYTLVQAGVLVAVHTLKDKRGPSPIPGVPQKLPEESAKTTLPESDDPAPVAEIRAKANELLDLTGPLPDPDSDLEERALALAKELEDFDNHWTGNASPGLEPEMSELFFIAGKRSSAERVADAGVRLLSSSFDKRKGRPPKGSARARGVARCYGVLGRVALAGDDAVAADANFKHALEWDELPEVYFWLGHCPSVSATEQEKYLRKFVGLVQARPTKAQARLLAKARERVPN